MKSLRLLVSIITVAVFCVPAIVRAAQPSPLLINEVQTCTSQSASQEFIELVNVSSETLDLTGWQVQYFAATQSPLTTPFRSFDLHGALAPGAYYLLSSNNYLTDKTTEHFSATLAQAGGHLRLTSIDTAKVVTVHDTVGWGTAASPETKATSAPSPGTTLVRHQDELGRPVDTDNNQQDFSVSTSPTPAAANVVVTPTAENPTPPDSSPLPTAEPEAIDPQPETINPELPPTEEPKPVALEISELLPNPASGHDSEAEFIELYNPTDESADLTGYKLETGSGRTYSYTFTEGSLAPHSYQAFNSDQTKLVLANNSGQAKLLAPDSTPLSQTLAYHGAKDGKAWANINGIWQWTVTPTPAASNILNVAVLSAKTTKAKTVAKAKAAKKTSAKRASSKKAPSKKTAKKATKKAPTKTAATKKKAVASTLTKDTGAKPPATVHPLVLAGVGGLALLYAAYEYRHDLANFVHKFRTNRKPGRAAG